MRIASKYKVTWDYFVFGVRKHASDEVYATNAENAVKSMQVEHRGFKKAGAIRVNYKAKHIKGR